MKGKFDKACLQVLKFLSLLNSTFQLAKCTSMLGKVIVILVFLNRRVFKEAYS